jgi:hypothetical protein
LVGVVGKVNNKNVIMNNSDKKIFTQKHSRKESNENGSWKLQRQLVSYFLR